MKYFTFAVLSLSLASSAFASIPVGRYECLRNGKVVKIIQISAAKLGGVELPVLEFTFPQSGDYKISGIGSVVRLSASTNYILNANTAIYFEDSGTIQSEDDCKKVN